jgi:NMD protein affecting ribosome stability and mRNA decay
MNANKCGHYDTFSKNGRCYDCYKADTDSGEVYQAPIVRCPKCAHYWEPDFESMSESQWCSYCEHDFEVGMTITTTFCSPALMDGVKPKGER